MKNRSIILTTILSLLVCGGLSSTARAAGAAPVTVVNTPNVIVANTPNVNVANAPNVNVANTTTNPVPIIGTVRDARNGVKIG
jgi:hypothetical protein